jgi:hypothetical protein
VNECPEFRPSVEEFSNFSKYIESIEPKALPFGIMKIIPPEGKFSRISFSIAVDRRCRWFEIRKMFRTGWKPRTTSYDEADVRLDCENWKKISSLVIMVALLSLIGWQDIMIAAPVRQDATGRAGRCVARIINNHKNMSLKNYRRFNTISSNYLNIQRK